MDVTTQEPRAIITKAQAFDDFMARRVLGEDLFGIRTITNGDTYGASNCVYDHKANGGCAIGKWIPEDVYKPHYEGAGVDTLFEENPDVRILFENPNSPFWSLLQQAHDNLAIYHHKTVVMGYPKDDPIVMDKWRIFRDRIIVATHYLAVTSDEEDAYDDGQNDE